MTISEADLILSNVLKDVYSSRETKQIGKIFWEDLFASRGGIDRVLHTQEVSKFNLAVEKPFALLVLCFLRSVHTKLVKL